MKTAFTFTVLISLLTAATFARADWPQWGRTNDRNMVSDQTNLPNLGKGNISFKDAKWDIRWTVKLGSLCYGNPTVADGRVFIGTNDRFWSDPRAKRSRGGLLLCIDDTTGKVLWRLLVPRYKEKIFGSGFDDLNVGVCSAVTIDGDKAYVVSSRGEVLCLDVNGQANGNDGPYRDEGKYMAPDSKEPPKLYRGDGDIIWRFDMIGGLDNAPHDATNCNILMSGDMLYVNTSNGVHRIPGEPTPKPDAPTLIVLNKKTGKLVAQDGCKIGHRTFHGNWSSPSLGKVAGKKLIFMGGGDGFLYAFEPPKTDPKAEKPAVFKSVWKFDCNPQEYKVDEDGQELDFWDGDATRADVPKNYKGPNSIIATPVCYKNRVYIAVGRDPEHGIARGMIHCIDATKTGDVTKTARIWSYDKIARTMSTVAIADGLLYISDYAGLVHCLDAETGKVCWIHNTKERIWSSTLVADGKVYVGTEKKNMFIFKTGRKKQLLATIKMPYKISTTPIVSNGTIYIPTARCLYAVGKTKK
jgi:outer membrane protein assembly factor BamB